MVTELKSEKYKGKLIKFAKYSNGVKGYIPFGISVVRDTKEKAFNSLKNEIDALHKKRLAVAKSEVGLRFKTKKLFYYKKLKDNKKTTVAVYEQTPSGLRELGETYWYTAAYKGEQSEVMDYLKSLNKIPKNMFPDGYYGWSKAEKYNMKIEQL